MASNLRDLQARAAAGGSPFLALAQKYGLAQPPRNWTEAFAMLSGILDTQQLELIRYMFMAPQEFQAENNAFSAGTPVDVAPGKDNAGTKVSTPTSTVPVAQPAPGAPTGVPGAAPRQAGPYGTGGIPTSTGGVQVRPQNPLQQSNVIYDELVRAGAPLSTFQQQPTTPGLTGPRIPGGGMVSDGMGGMERRVDPADLEQGGNAVRRAAK